jgi:AcrR family transcriptional regulator
VPRRGLDREQVLEAAVRIADEGLERVTFARLARELGVRAPSLYNHVNGRAELLGLISLRGLGELGDAIATAAAGLSGEDALRATAHAYRAYALAHPGSYEATLALGRKPAPALRLAADRLLELLAAILRSWQLQNEEAVDAIRAVRSALHGFVALERDGGFALPRDTDASFERLLDLLVAGLRSADAGRLA